MSKTYRANQFSNKQWIDRAKRKSIRKNKETMLNNENLTRMGKAVTMAYRHSSGFWADININFK